MATFKKRGSKPVEFQTKSTATGKLLPDSKKGLITTIDSVNNKNTEGSIETVNKLDGLPESLILKFQDLQIKSNDLIVECESFSAKDMSESFSQLEPEAIALVKQKKNVNNCIETLFDEYKIQNLSKKDSKVIIWKKELNVIIDKSQKSVDDCKPLMDQVRIERKNLALEDDKELEGPDFGEDFDKVN